MAAGVPCPRSYHAIRRLNDRALIFKCEAEWLGLEGDPLMFDHGWDPDLRGWGRGG